MTIMVSDYFDHADERWREAIMWYINLILAGDTHTYEHPWVIFQNWSFILWPTSGAYFFHAEDSVERITLEHLNAMLDYHGDRAIECGCVKDDFERTLARFTKNPHFLVLIATQQENQSIVLQKDPARRGVLRVSTTIPHS